MIEIAIRDGLLHDEDVADLVDERIFYDFVPEDEAYPRVKLTQIGEERQLPFDGPDSLVKLRLQVDCYSLGNKQEVRDLAAAVRKKLHGFAGQMGDEDQVTFRCIKLENQQDDKKDSAAVSGDPIFRVIQDYFVWFIDPDLDDSEDGDGDETSGIVGNFNMGEGEGEEIGG